MKTNDYARCRGCGRLTKKSTAQLIEGSYYGPECSKRYGEESSEVIDDKPED